jgi:hypothetical protein
MGPAVGMETSIGATADSIDRSTYRRPAGRILLYPTLCTFQRRQRPRSTTAPAVSTASLKPRARWTGFVSAHLPSYRDHLDRVYFLVKRLKPFEIDDFLWLAGVGSVANSVIKTVRSYFQPGVCLPDRPDSASDIAVLSGHLVLQAVSEWRRYEIHLSAGLCGSRWGNRQLGEPAAAPETTQCLGTAL